MTEPEWDQMRIGVEQLRSVLLAYVVAHSDEGPEFQSEDVDAFIDAFELSLCQLSEGIRYGYRVIFDEIQHRYHIGQRSDQQLDRFRAKVPDALGQGDLSGLQDLVAAGGLPADYFGFDLATLDEMRSVAAHLLHLRRFEEARNAYYFLIFMCPYSCVLLVGLGEAELGLGHIAESLQCFRIASQMFPTDLAPYYRFVETAFGAGLTDEAVSFVEEASRVLETVRELLPEAEERTQELRIFLDQLVSGTFYTNRGAEA